MAIELDANFSDLIQQVSLVQEKMESLRKNFLTVSKSTITYDTANKKLIGTLKGVGTAGTDLTQTLAKTKTGWNLTTQAVDNQARSLKEVAAAADETDRQLEELLETNAALARQEAETARGRGVRSQLTNKDLAVRAVNPAATQDELINFRNSQLALEKFAQANNLTIDQINAKWKIVANGGVLEYSEENVKLTALILKHEESIRNLGATEAKQKAEVIKLIASERAAIEKVELAHDKQKQEVIRLLAEERKAIEAVNLTHDKQKQEVIALLAQERAAVAKTAEAKAAAARAVQKDHLSAIKLNDERNRILQIRTTLQARLQKQLSAAPDATFGQVKSLTEANQKLQDYLIKTKTTLATVEGLWGKLDNGSIEGYKADQVELIGLMRTVEAEAKNLGQIPEELNKGRTAAEGLGLSMRNVARIIAVSAIHRTVGLITTALRDGIQAASELEIAISEIRTISQDAQLSFARFSQEVKGVSDAFGFDILDTAEAAYQSLSNQIAEGAETFRFLESAGRFAIAAVATQEEAVNLLTASLNAYNLTVEDTDAVSASFFKTIELGRVRAEELATTIGNILVPANQLGINLNEVQAALATLTIQGVKANQAQTLLRNVLLKLIKPTDQLKADLRALGFESGKAAIDTLGFVTVLGELAESAGGLEGTGEQFGRIRAIVAQLGLTGGKSLEIFRKNLEEIEGATESFEAAVKIGFESAAKTIQIETRRMKNFFIVNVGQSLLQTLASISKTIGGLSNAVRVLSTAVGLAFGPAVTAAIVAGILKANAAIILFRASIVKLGLAAATTAAITTGVLVAAIVAVTVAVSTFVVIANNEIDTFTDNWIAKIQDAATATATATARSAASVVKSFKNISKEILLASAEVNKGLNAVIDGGLLNFELAVKDIKLETKDFETAFKKATSEITKDLTTATNEIKQFSGVLKGLRKEQRDFALDIEFTTEEDPKKQFDNLVNQIKTLQARGTALLDVDPQQFEDQGLSEDAAARRVVEAREEGIELLKKSRGLLKELKKLSEDSAKVNIKAQDKIDDLNSKGSKLRRDSLIKDDELQKKIIAAQAKGDEDAVFEAKRKLENNRTDSREKIAALLKERETFRKTLTDLPKVDFKAVFDNLIEAQRQAFVDLREDRRKAELALQDELEARELKRVAIVEAARRVAKTEDLITGAPDEDNRDVLEVNARERLEALKSLAAAQAAINADGVAGEQTLAAIIRETAVFDAQFSKLTLENAKAELKTKNEAVVVAVENLKLKRQELAANEANFRLLTRSATEIEKLGTTGLGDLDIAAQLGIASNAGIGQVQNFTEALANLKIDPNSPNDLARLKDAIADLLPFAEARPEGTFGISQIITNLNTALNSVPDVRNIFGDFKDLQSVQTALRSTAKSLKDAVQQVAEAEKEAGVKEEERKGPLQEILDITAALAIAQKEYADQLARTSRLIGGAVPPVLPPPVLPDVRHGGMPNRFAAGGMAGSDRISALLSPGEFVMNAASSRRFYSKLVGLNSDPSRFAAGGSAGEGTTVGDINISMNSSNNESIDVTRMGQLLRREIRRGTLKI